MTQNPQDAPGRWTQTAPGSPPVFSGAGAPSVPPSRGSATGMVALIVAVVAVTVSAVLSAITGFLAAHAAMAHAIELSPSGLENLSEHQVLSLLSPVRGLVLWAEIGFWVGTILGLWALVQGIVAIATRAGRGQGIAAVVVAAAGPVLFGVVVGAAITAGIAAGASV